MTSTDAFPMTSATSRMTGWRVTAWAATISLALSAGAGPAVPRPAAPSGPPVVSDLLDDAELDGHVFQVVKRRLSWAEADGACRKAGGHLAVIATPAEQALILGALDGPVYPKYARWVGLSCGTDGGWRWADGSVIDFANWAGGVAPTPGRAGQVALLSGRDGGRWEAAPAGDRYWYICEWDRPGATPHRTATATVAAVASAPAKPVSAAVPVPAAVAAPSAPLPAAAAAGFDVTIDAKCGVSSTRMSLGPVRRGQRLTFQYVSGAWTAFPSRKYPPGSPDAVPPAHENVLPLRLCENVDGQVTQLVEVPGGTHGKPFVYIAPRDLADLVLNNRDGRPENNQGNVVYRVTGLDVAGKP